VFVPQAHCKEDRNAGFVSIRQEKFVRGREYKCTWSIPGSCFLGAE
jgi:hypothetical protein